MRLRNGLFSGTYPLIYNHPWSFYMWIRSTYASLFLESLSHITRSICTKLPILLPWVSRGQITSLNVIPPSLTYLQISIRPYYKSTTMFRPFSHSTSFSNPWQKCSSKQQQRPCKYRHTVTSPFFEVLISNFEKKNHLNFFMSQFNDYSITLKLGLGLVSSHCIKLRYFKKIV